jgi:hypothetical protein
VGVADVLDFLEKPGSNTQPTEPILSRIHVRYLVSQAFIAS